MKENTEARLAGLRAALALLALISLVALFLSSGIPTRQPASTTDPTPRPPSRSRDVTWRSPPTSDNGVER